MAGQLQQQLSKAELIAMGSMVSGSAVGSHPAPYLNGLLC